MPPYTKARRGILRRWPWKTSIAFGLSKAMEPDAILGVGASGLPPTPESFAAHPASFAPPMPIDAQYNV
jgi:hypothetical protein